MLAISLRLGKIGLSVVNGRSVQSGFWLSVNSGLIWLRGEMQREIEGGMGSHRPANHMICSL